MFDFFFAGFIFACVLFYCVGKYLLKKSNGLVIYNNGERVE